ncbi:hypothetical protein SEA_MAKAI_32 [Arthrobacter phage Makai]|nr:hypothetical protein SEA_MAKAI_32 [Arthrobacter phage Makai]QPX62495.1 hypothetical protein SEA_TRUCKEE_31 [Arthrobacter phage Truckee]
MDSTQQFIIALLGAIGASGFLATAAKGIFSMVTRRAVRERAKNTSYLAQAQKEIERREDAEAETEAEIKLRRKAEHHVALLQHQLILLGAKPVKNDHDEE